jgi:hypothetical protein
MPNERDTFKWTLEVFGYNYYRYEGGIKVEENRQRVIDLYDEAVAERDAQTAENNHYQQKCIELVDEVCALRVRLREAAADRDELKEIAKHNANAAIEALASSHVDEYEVTGMTSVGVVIPMIFDLPNHYKPGDKVRVMKVKDSSEN